MNFDAHIGPIQSKTVPPQGMTSTVTLLKSERGYFALKHSDRAPFVDWLKREAHLLKALESTDLPVPRCIALDEQTNSATLLMTALPGEPLYALLCRGVSNPVRLDLFEQFGRTLSAIHRTKLPALLQSDRPWLDRILDEARANVAQGYAWPDAPPIHSFAAARPQPMPEVLIHGDYTLDNVLVDAGRITGVIDWGRGDVGDPRYDLALATSPQHPEVVSLDEADIKAFYTGYSGERLTRDECNWFNDLYEYF